MADEEPPNEIECVTPDYYPIDPSFIDPPESPLNLMEALQPNEDLSDDRISELMQQFLKEFTIRYPTSGPPLFMGSLEQALTNSVYNYQNTRPLILFVYDGRSVYTNNFCQQVLCADDMTRYIEENFIVWAWDRTNETNYRQLLKILGKHLGTHIEDKVALLPIEQFPVLICLAFNNGRVEFINIIQGHASHDHALELLKEARSRFDVCIPTPSSADPLWMPGVFEDWSMPPSTLKSIEKTSEEFKTIASEYARQAEHVIQIDKIENSSWSDKYLVQKTAIRGFRGNNQIEEFLVFPCSHVQAKYILEKGFKHDHHVKTYRKGLHFQSPETYKKNYSSSDSVNDRPDALLVCHVLVGRTCRKDEIIRTSPLAYDSTTDGLGTYIVDLNQSILPIYLLYYEIKETSSIIN